MAHIPATTCIASRLAIHSLIVSADNRLVMGRSVTSIANYSTSCQVFFKLCSSCSSPVLFGFVMLDGGLNESCVTFNDLVNRVSKTLSCLPHMIEIAMVHRT